MPINADENKNLLICVHRRPIPFLDSKLNLAKFVKAFFAYNPLGGFQRAPEDASRSPRRHSDRRVRARPEPRQRSQSVLGMLIESCRGATQSSRRIVI